MKDSSRLSTAVLTPSSWHIFLRSGRPTTAANPSTSGLSVLAQYWSLAAWSSHAGATSVSAFIRPRWATEGNADCAAAAALPPLPEANAAACW